MHNTIPNKKEEFMIRFHFQMNNEFKWNLVLFGKKTT